MELTKLEKALVIGTILNAIGADKLEEYVELETLRPVIKVLDKFNKRTTPGEKKEATINLVNVMIKDLLEDKRPIKVKQ